MTLSPVLRFLGRLLTGAIFLIYLCVGGSSAILMLKKNYIRIQDISALHDVIRKAVATDDLGEVSKWIRYRPAFETKQITNIVTQESANLDFSTFMQLSGR